MTTTYFKRKFCSVRQLVLLLTALMFCCFLYINYAQNFAQDAETSQGDSAQKQQQDGLQTSSWNIFDGSSSSQFADPAPQSFQSAESKGPGPNVYNNGITRTEFDGLDKAVDEGQGQRVEVEEEEEKDGKEEEEEVNEEEEEEENEEEEEEKDKDQDEEKEEKKDEKEEEETDEPANKDGQDEEAEDKEDNKPNIKAPPPKVPVPPAPQNVVPKEDKPSVPQSGTSAFYRSLANMKQVPGSHRIFNSTSWADEEVQHYRENKWFNIPVTLQELMPGPFRMNINSDTEPDVLVTLHIPRTGGNSFMTKITHFADVEPPCVCDDVDENTDLSKLKCECINKNRMVWNFNRFTVGAPCGKNPDFTELMTCVPRWYAHKLGTRRTEHNKYHYITILRDPVDRFLGEWMEVRRGGLFRYTHVCDHKVKFYKKCFDEKEDNSDLSLEEFMDCPDNVAFNRQTRMLANLSLVQCLDDDVTTMTREERDEYMLFSAKKNLAEKFDFFALLEYIQNSGKLFNTRFFQFRLNNREVGKSSVQDYTELKEKRPDLIDKVIEKNRLDVRLYQFARSLLFMRFTAGNIPIGKKFTFVES